MISQEPELCLHDAFVDAREKRHAHISTEHLLLAILREECIAAHVLQSCGVDLDGLRSHLATIVEKTPVWSQDPDTQPTSEFQRVIQRAIKNAQSFHKGVVTSAHLLPCILVEKQSRAAALLLEHGATQYDLLHCLEHGAPPRPVAPELLDATEVQVILLNDDATPMQFVADVLQRFFGMDAEEAKEVVLEVHRNGKGLCGLYSRETGTAMAAQVLAYARRHGHPLRCITTVPE